MFHSVFVTVAVWKTDPPFSCRALCSLAQVSCSVVVPVMLCQAAKAAGFSLPGWLHELAARRAQLHSGWHSHVGASGAVLGSWLQDVPSWAIPMTSQMEKTCLVRFYVTKLLGQKSKCDKWELSRENCGELNVRWLQPSLGSWQFHTCSWQWLVMFSTFCVMMYLLEHVVFLLIPLLPLC